MLSIEEIAQRFDAIPPATPQRWHVQTLVPSRVHLSRGRAGEYSIFLEGALDTFGRLPPYKGIEHSDEVRSLPAGRSFPALRLSSADAQVGNRVMAHVAYELIARIENDAPVVG